MENKRYLKKRKKVRICKKQIDDEGIRTIDLPLQMREHYHFAIRATFVVRFLNSLYSFAFLKRTKNLFSIIIHFNMVTFVFNHEFETLFEGSYCISQHFIGDLFKRLSYSLFQFCIFNLNTCFIHLTADETPQEEIKWLK